MLKLEVLENELDRVHESYLALLEAVTEARSVSAATLPLLEKLLEENKEDKRDIYSQVEECDLCPEYTFLCDHDVDHEIEVEVEEDEEDDEVEEVEEEEVDGEEEVEEEEDK